MTLAYKIYSDAPTFDDRDAEILAARIVARDKLPGARVGDFVKMLDGTLRRFTHDWGDDIQTTVKQGADHYSASFYLSFGGGSSFSGSLDPGLPKSRFSDAGETQDGGFWFFHHDHAGAHRGVYFKIPCRVFAQKEGP